MLKKWDVKGKIPLAYDAGKTLDTILLTDIVVTSEEAKNFEQDMQQRLQDAQKRWDEYQKKLVEDFPVWGNMQSVVRSYGEFIDENPNNRWLENLHERMNRRLSAYFTDYMKDYYKELFGTDSVVNEKYKGYRMNRLQERFNEFRAVCLAVSGQGWASSPLQKKQVGKFATLCVQRGNLQYAGITWAFEQTIRVTKVEARFESTRLDNDYRYMIFSGNLIAERWNYRTERVESVADRSVFPYGKIERWRNGQWVELWAGSQDIRVNPWVFTSFKLQYRDYLDATFSQGSAYTEFSSILKNGPYCESSTSVNLNSGGFNTNTSGLLHLRITYSRDGPSFADLWKEACYQ